MTEYYIGSDAGGKLRKYSDLLTIVEVNLKFYKNTTDVNLNILCEFLRGKNKKGLDKFCEQHGNSEFGSMLYERYIKVILDKDLMEEVSKMELYQEKMQLRYHTPAEADAIWEKANIETAKKLISRGMSLEDIVEITELPIKKVQQMINRYSKGKQQP
jgi:hypothetical protein